MGDFVQMAGSVSGTETRVRIPRGYPRWWQRRSALISMGRPLSCRPTCLIPFGWAVRGSAGVDGLGKIVLRGEVRVA